eukprot:5999793-Prymnesium_polylepis.1
MKNAPRIVSPRATYCTFTGLGSPSSGSRLPLPMDGVRHHARERPRAIPPWVSRMPPSILP